MVVYGTVVPVTGGASMPKHVHQLPSRCSWKPLLVEDNDPSGFDFLLY